MHAPTVRTRIARVCGALVIATVLVALTRHPVDAQAPNRLMAESCPVATSPMNFAPTNSEQCFTVPPGVTQIAAVLIGGFGGTGYNPIGAPPPLGGNGATVQAVVYVQPGEVIHVDVGSPGMPGGLPLPTITPGAGGFNGGGRGGTSALAANQPPAAGGGGETDLRAEPSAGCGTSTAAVASLASRLLVAGGGGGGGETNGNSGGDGGGSGGLSGVIGQSGFDGIFETGRDGKGGGRATATGAGAGGGAGSVGGSGGAPGRPGCGGNGGSGTGGGGGGGGYFGAGGGGGGAEGAAGSGAGGGGGGGSSYADPLRTCNATSGGQQLASARVGPRVFIQFPPRTPCPTLTFVPDVSSAGFVVNAVGTGWEPGESVDLVWRELGSLPADLPLGTVTPTTAGSFTFTILLMTHAEIGERVLVGYQLKPILSGSAPLLVAASPEEPPTFLFRR